MNKPDARLRDLFDLYVSRRIVEKYGFDEMAALKSFLRSETYQMLIDRETEVYLMSPEIVFDMWECEQITHDPRNSIYIRA